MEKYPNDLDPFNHNMNNMNTINSVNSINKMNILLILKVKSQEKPGLVCNRLSQTLFTQTTTLTNRS